MLNKTTNKMNIIRIGQKILDLNEMTNNGTYEIESGIEVETFILNEFEFRFGFEIDFSHNAYGMNPYDEPERVDKVYLTEFIDVVDLDTDVIIKLSEQDKRLILAIAKEKYNGI